MSNTIHAYAINDVNIVVKCPDGELCFHGSCGNLANREESRFSHSKNYDYDNIIIDDDTLRCDIGKSGRPLKRSFKLYKNWNN